MDKVELKKIVEKYNAKVTEINAIAETNSDLKKLIDDYQSKALPIATIATNLKVSAGFVKTYFTAGVQGLPYDEDDINYYGIETVLKKVDLTPETFSMDGWVFGAVALPKIVIDWTIGTRCKFSNSEGLQSVNCIYEVAYISDGYILIVPVEGMTIEANGHKIDTPRVVSKLVASNMKPVLTYQ